MSWMIPEIVPPQGTPSIYEAELFTSVQAALDAIPAGATLHFRGGLTWAPPTAAGWIIRKPVEILGDGHATLWQPYTDGSANGSKDSTVWTIGDAALAAFGNISIRSGRIQAALTPTVNTGTGDGIRVVPPLSGTYNNILLDGLTVWGMGHDALHCDPGAASSSDLMVMRDCNFYLSRHINVYCAYTAAPTFEACYVNGAQGYGMHLAIGAGAARLRGCYFENNWAAATGADPTLDCQLRCDLCHGMSILGGSFENWSTAGGGVALTAILMNNCAGFVVDGVLFINATPVAGTIGVNVWGNSTGEVGAGCAWQNVDTLVASTDGSGHARVGVGGILGYNAITARGLVSLAYTDRTVSVSRPRGTARIFGKEERRDAQAAAIGSMVLVTGNKFSGGTMRIMAILCITATQGGNPTVQGTLAWTSPSGARTKVFPAAPLDFGAAADSADIFPIEVMPDTNVTFSTALGGPAITTGRYALRLVPEAI